MRYSSHISAIIPSTEAIAFELSGLKVSSLDALS